MDKMKVEGLNAQFFGELELQKENKRKVALWCHCSNAVAPQHKLNYRAVALQCRGARLAILYEFWTILQLWDTIFLSFKRQIEPFSPYSSS